MQEGVVFQSKYIMFMLLYGTVSNIIAKTCTRRFTETIIYLFMLTSTNNILSNMHYIFVQAQYHVSLFFTM
jgi:hypothetical protein